MLSDRFSAAEKAETEIDWEEESEMGDPEEGELI
jgi:hypothetical protein